MPQKWTLIRVLTHTDAADAMTDFLAELGAQSVSTSQEGGDVGSARVTVDAYLPLDDNTGDRVFQVKHHLDGLEAFGLETKPARVSVKVVEFGDWQTDWRSFFPPQRFGNRLLVTPSWEPIPDDAPPVIVTLDPGMAFGTGTHASTQLCLEFIDRLAEFTGIDGWRAADIGTGSGILSIAAVKLGAASAVAVDVDAKVLPIARENATINGVSDRLEFLVGTLEGVRGEFDLLLMNILAKVIIPSMPLIAARLSARGFAVLSGITDAEAEAVHEAVNEHDLLADTRLNRDGWTAFLVRKP